MPGPHVSWQLLVCPIAFRLLALKSTPARAAAPSIANLYAHLQCLPADDSSSTRCHSLQQSPSVSCFSYSNAEVEEQIAHLRAELLHKEQENMCVQLQLQQEVQQRERAQKKVCSLLMTHDPLI